MSPMLARIFVTSISVLGLLFAQGAGALVTSSQTTTAVGPLNIGDTFDVDVLLTWDGSATEGLVGIFTSIEWDNTQLQFNGPAVFPINTNFETRPVPLKGSSYAPALSRLGTIENGISGDDLTSTARVIQYAQGAVMPLNATSAMTDELITRLNFTVVGAGDGVAEIAGVRLIGDEITGDVGVFGAPIAITIPEPGSSLLALSSLISVFGVVAVRRRA